MNKIRKDIVATFYIIFVIVTLVACGNKTENYGLTKTVKQGSFVIHYAKGDKQAAQDVMSILEKRQPDLLKKLNISNPETVQFYLFSDKQQYLDTFSGQMRNLHAGFSVGNNAVYMLSPSVYKTSKAAYEWQENASIHELTHCYISQFFNKSSGNSLLNEGAAFYLNANEEEVKESMRQVRVKRPDYWTLQTNYDVISACGPAYYAYLENVYGWDKVLKLLESCDYEQALGKDEQTVISEWLESYETN